MMGNAMAFLSKFQYEVFFSYAWVNNYPEDESNPESGWITRFKARLQPRLNERLGRPDSARFFFDRSSLARNQDFDQRIAQALRQSATVIAFLSDGYLASPSCHDEMRQFHEIAGANAGRLFLVRLEDTDRSQWPANYQQYLHNIIGYRFFHKDPTNGTTGKLQPGNGEFDTEFERLRSDLAAQLKAMQNDETPAGTEPPASRPQPTVLIAKTTPDLRQEHRALTSYCASAGLRVLPEASWPAAPEAFQQAFAGALQPSHLFVQLLSHCYTDREPQFPDGIETYQYQQAQQAGLTILQWRDKATKLDAVDDEAHRALITAADVRTALPAVFHQEVVERTRRAFQIDQDAKHEAADSSQAKLVLVKADAADAGPTDRIVQSLIAANIRCRVSQNGVPMVERLREIPFDALIVVLGQCGNDWIELRGDELMAVDLNLKDQVPLRAYCHWDVRRLAPYVGRDMLQVVAPAELDVLIQAIQRRGAAR